MNRIPSSPTSFFPPLRPPVRPSASNPSRGPAAGQRANEPLTCFRCYLAGWMEMGLGWDGMAPRTRRCCLGGGGGVGEWEKGESGRGGNWAMLARPLSLGGLCKLGTWGLGSVHLDSVDAAGLRGLGSRLRGMPASGSVEVWMCGLCFFVSAGRVRLRLGGRHTQHTTHTHTW